jgi:Ni,Fe-hydrogenase III small subunit
MIEQHIAIPWVMHSGMQVHYRIVVGLEEFARTIDQLDREVFQGAPWTWRPIYSGEVPIAIATPGAPPTQPRYLIEALSAVPRQAPPQRAEKPELEVVEGGVPS